MHRVVVALVLLADPMNALERLASGRRRVLRLEKEQVSPAVQRNVYRHLPHDSDKHVARDSRLNVAVSVARRLLELVDNVRVGIGGLRRVNETHGRRPRSACARHHNTVLCKLVR
jgi:hypothetical protein